MGEIDDVYKGEAEAIDQDFLEELKNGGNHDKIFEKYRKEILKARTKFEKDYKKFNSAEKRRIAKMKKKLPRTEKFEVLTVKHFDFKFNFWEKLFMKINVGWFNFTRKVKRFWVELFPSWMIYTACKIRDFFKYNFRDFREWREEEIENSKEYCVKAATSVFEIIKKWGIFWKEILGKVMFWKKTEGEKDEGKSGEAKEEDET